MKSVIITVLLVILTCVFLSGQVVGTIGWTLALTTSSTSPGVGWFYNGYHDIHYDPLSGLTVLDTDNYSASPNNANAIYSDRLSTFNAANSALTYISDNGQVDNSGCYSSITAPNGQDTYHSTYHPVGQEFLDTTRHRVWTFGGVAGAYEWPEWWYNQLTMSGPSANWTYVTQAHALPIFTTASNTTLSAVLGSSDTTLSLSSLTFAYNGAVFTIDDGLGNQEYVRVTGNGGRPCVGGSGGTNPLTVQRHMWGTIARGHSQGASVKLVAGRFNSGVIVHDPVDDVFVLLSADAGGGAYLESIYCDTSVNPTPGTLTAAQSTAGCGVADGWTDISKATACTDNACFPTQGSGINQKGVPNGFTYSNAVWDPNNNRIMTYGGLYGCCTAVSQVWYYYPATKTWTPRTAGLAKPSDTFTAVTCTGTTATFDASLSNNLGCTLGTNNVTSSTITNPTLNQILNIKLAQGTTGQKTFAWPANVRNPPPYTPAGTSVSGTLNTVLASFKYDGTNWNAINPPTSGNNNEGGRIAHTWDTNANVYRYHLTAHQPGSDGQFAAYDPQDWIFDPSTDTWTQLNEGTCSPTTQTCGPYLAETMTFDSVHNSVIMWAATMHTNGSVQLGPATIWIGQLTTPIKVFTQGNTVYQGRVTH